MSYDFTVVIPELIPTITNPNAAMALHNAMCEDISTPAPDDVVRFVDELDRTYGFQRDDEHCILAADVDPDARGAVVPTSWRSANFNRTVLLTMTRDYGFGLYDTSTHRLYDPRDHLAGLNVEIDGGIHVPYLSMGLLSELFERPDSQSPWLVVDRSDHDYIQARFPHGCDVDVEYRAGGPQQHFHATTPDRALAQRVIWGWAHQDDDWKRLLGWEPLLLDE